MVSIRAGRLRLRSARSIPGGVTREPIPLHSARPAIGCADERVRFCVTFDPDGLFSRDRSSDWVNVSHVLGGEYVGLEEIDNDLWDVYFGPLKLGRMNAMTLTIEDALGRMRRRRLSPMSPD